MPTGTPYESFVLPYPIRVDDFAETTTLQTVPALYLLSHTHSDHINGLAAKSFASIVFCSVDAKEMLLRHEVYAERALKQMDVRTECVRTFQHLKVSPKVLGDGKLCYHGSRDLLVRSSHAFRDQTIKTYFRNHFPSMYLTDTSCRTKTISP
jgi:DNA cross-link repair 1C protein